MTWATLIARNLVRRPVRTLLTAAGVALGVALIVALLSISAGVRRTAGDLIHVGRADFGLFQSGVSDLTRSLLPETLENQVAAQRSVAQTAVLFLYVTDIGGQSSSLLFGMKPGEFPAQRLTLVAGSRNGLLLGDAAARRLKLRPGSTIRVAGRDFRVGGIFHSGDRFEDAGAVLPLSDVQRLARRPGEVTTIAVTVKLGQKPRPVADRIARRVALLIVGEALAIATIALALGLGVGILAADEFTHRTGLSTLVSPDFTMGVFAWGLAFALGVGLVGAAYPTWRAIRLQPVEALRRE